MVRSRYNDTIHWPLLLVSLALLAVGLVNLFSAAYASQPSYFFSQLAWVGLAMVTGLAVFVVDYRVYERLAYFLYAIALIFLVLVLFSREVAGAHRWLVLGPIRFQPSELAKVVLVLTLAKYFHNAITPPNGFTAWQLRKLLAMLAAPLLLILLEPDLGTTLLLGAISFTVILFAKLRARTILALILIAVISLPIAWNYVLKPYQKQRVITMFDPDSDPRGTGYHRRQSIIAVGSGQMLGKGYREGTQTQLRFLPEQHTDFIFSVWAEEAGFSGGAIVLILYAAMVLSGVHIASKAREKFGVLLAVGATAVIFWQTFINIGMVLGLLPVVGVTLPLMSYGGTSLVVTMVCLALLLNVYARRKLF